MVSKWSPGHVEKKDEKGTDQNPGLVSVVDSTSVKTLADFKYYSSQIADIDPTGVKKASYTATNTALRSCPTVGPKWGAEASPLPPVADANLCDCMYDASACVVSESLSEKRYSKLFSTVCGYTDCSGLAANATTGEYGAYSMCSTKEQLAFALNKYYVEQDKAADACDFAGSATVKSVTKPTGTCSAQMKEAGSAGVGTISTEGNGKGKSGADSDSATSETSSSAGVVSVHSSVVFGSFQVTAYIATALLAGVGMIAL